jgi:hypothetical protein
MQFAFTMVSVTAIDRREEGWGVTVGDANERSLRTRIRQLSSLPQKFEESRVGERVISGLVAMIVVIGVAANLPESPIKRSIAPILSPVAVPANIDWGWALFAPSVSTRLETIEVHVTMANGRDKVWAVKPGDRVIGAFASIHWKQLMSQSVVNPQIRGGIARWAVREVTGPSEHPVRVAMILRTENLPPPGEDGRGATAMKILYQEDLTGPH